MDEQASSLSPTPRPGGQPAGCSHPSAGNVGGEDSPAGLALPPLLVADESEPLGPRLIGTDWGQDLPSGYSRTARKNEALTVA